MPICGSQVTLCDVPIRFDTYQGCGHACSYCFVSRKRDISEIKNAETATALRDFINGKRTKTTSWCDWNIPLHWGGLSDPFQPVERVRKRSLEALKVFAETGYPFIVSTKSTLITEEPWFSILKECNCVVQFSACSPLFDKVERGAATYAERISAASKIAPYKRVIIRTQPYIPYIFLDVLRAIPMYSQSGIYGIILEGMKYTKPAVKGLISSGKDFVYPVETLIPHFEAIRDKAHQNGMKFYSGENRLRAMSDSLCCCGVDGLGWRVNEGNVNHHLFDEKGAVFTEKMQETGTADAFTSVHQDTISRLRLQMMSFKDAMSEESKRPYPFENQRGGGYSRSKNQNKSESISEAPSKDRGGRRRMLTDILEQTAWPGTISVLPSGPSQRMRLTTKCAKYFRFLQSRTYSGSLAS